jgi:hypothetical protein
VNGYSPLDGDIHVGNVVQEELDELFVLVLSDPLDEGLRSELLTELVRGQSVLGETVVKVVDD